jgi:hypothetical protein
MSDSGEDSIVHSLEYSGFVEEYHTINLNTLEIFQNLNLSEDEYASDEEISNLIQENDRYGDEQSWENEDFSDDSDVLLPLDLNSPILSEDLDSESETIEYLDHETYFQTFSDDIDTLLSLLDLIDEMKNKRKRKQVCRFNLVGKCNKGDLCQFIHESKEEKKEIPSNVPCEFFKIGKCKFGNFCKFLHEEKKENLTCSICVDSINSRFGILESCDHTFCLSCIMDWRKENIENSKKCPICREKSNFVIPSNNHVVGEEKKELISMYKEKSKEIPCKFEKICGSCAFGEHCFFKHK